MSPTVPGPPEGPSWKYDNDFTGGRSPEGLSWDDENYPMPPSDRVLWERQARANGMPPSPYPLPHPQASVTAYSRKQTNHLLHLVLSFVTCGAWLLVWPCVWAWNKFGPRNRTVYQ